MSELRVKKSMNGAMPSCSNSPLVDHLDKELLAEKQMDKTAYSSIGLTQNLEIQGNVNLVKRKRGRPRKERLDGEAKVDNKPKCGRGRPRRYPIVESCSDVKIQNQIVNQSPTRSDTSLIQQAEHSDDISSSKVYQSPRVTVFEGIPCTNKTISGKPFVNKPTLNVKPNEYSSIHSYPDQLTVNMSRNKQNIRSNGLTRGESKSPASISGPTFDSLLKCEICYEEFSSQEHFSYHLHKHFDSYDEYIAYMRQKNGNRISSTSTQGESTMYESSDERLKVGICTSDRRSTQGGDRSQVVELDTESTLSASEMEFPSPNAGALKKEVKVSLKHHTTKYKLSNGHSTVKVKNTLDKNESCDVQIKPESAYSMLPLDKKYGGEKRIIVTKGDLKIAIKYGDDTKSKAQEESLNKMGTCKAIVDKGLTLAEKEDLKQGLNKIESFTDRKKRNALKELSVNQTEKVSKGIVGHNTYTKSTQSKSMYRKRKSLHETCESSSTSQSETDKITNHQRKDMSSALNHKSKCRKEGELFSNQSLTKSDTVQEDTNSGSLADKLEIQVMRFEEKDVIMKHACLPSNSSVSPEKIRLIKDQRLLKQQVAFKRMYKTQHKLNLENYPNKESTSVFNTCKKDDEVVNIWIDSIYNECGSSFMDRPSEKHLKLKSASTNGYKLLKAKRFRSKPVAKEKHKHGSSQDKGPFTHQLKSPCNAQLRHDKDTKQLNKHEGASKHLAKGKRDDFFSKCNRTNHLVETCRVDPTLSDGDDLSRTKQIKKLECQLGMSCPHLKEGSIELFQAGNQRTSSDISLSNQHVYMQTDRTVKDQDHMPHLRENSSVRHFNPLDERRRTTFDTKAENDPGSKRQLEDIELARSLGFSLSDDSSDGEDICFGDYSKDETEALEECTSLSNIVIPFRDINTSSLCCSPVVNDCNLNHTALSTPTILSIEESKDITCGLADSFRELKVNPLNDFDEPDSPQHPMSAMKGMDTVCPIPNSTGDLNIYQMPMFDSCLSVSSVSCIEAENDNGQVAKLCPKDSDQDKDKTDVTERDSEQILVKSCVHQSGSEQNLVKSCVHQSGSEQIQVRTGILQSDSDQDKDKTDITERDSVQILVKSGVHQSDSEQNLVKSDVHQSDSEQNLVKSDVHQSDSEQNLVKSDVTERDSKQNLVKTDVNQSDSEQNLVKAGGHQSDSEQTLVIKTDADQSVTDRDEVSGISSMEAEISHQRTGQQSDEDFSISNPNEIGYVSPVTDFKKHEPGQLAVIIDHDRSVTYPNVKKCENAAVESNRMLFDTPLDAMSPLKPCVMHQCNTCNKRFRTNASLRLHGCNRHSPDSVITINSDSDTDLKESTRKLEKKKKLKINREVVAANRHIKCPLCSLEVSNKSFFQHKLNCKPPVSHQSTDFDNTSSKAQETVNSVDDTDTSTEVSGNSGTDLKVIFKKVKLSNSIVNGTSLKLYGSLENPMWKIEMSKEPKGDEELVTKADNRDADNLNGDEFHWESTVKHSVDKRRDEAVASNKKENENSITDGKLDINSENKPNCAVTVQKNKEELEDKVTKGNHQSQMDKLTRNTDDKKSKGETITDFEKQLLVVDHSLVKGKDKPRKRHRSVWKTPQNHKKDLHVESKQDQNKEEDRNVPQKHFINSKMAQKIYKRDKERNRSFNDGLPDLPDFSKSGVLLDNLPELVHGKSSSEVGKNTKSSNIIEEKSHVDENSNVLQSHKVLKKSVESLAIVPNSKSKEMFNPAGIPTEKLSQNRCYGSNDSTFSLHSYKIPKFDFKNSKFSAFDSTKGFSGNDSNYYPNSTSFLKSSNLIGALGEASEISSVGIGGTDSSTSYEREDDSLGQQNNNIYFDRENSISFGRDKSGIGRVNDSISFDRGNRSVSFDQGNCSVSFDLGNYSGSSCFEENISWFARDGNNTTLRNPYAISPQEHSMSPSEDAFHNSGFNTTKHQQSEFSLLGHPGTWEKYMNNYNHEMGKGRVRNWSGDVLRRKGVLTSTRYVKHAKTEKKREVNELSTLSCSLDQAEDSIKRRRLNRYQIDVEDKRIVKTKQSSDGSMAGCKLQSTNRHTKRSPIRFPGGTVTEENSRKDSQTKELLQISIEVEPWVRDFQDIEEEAALIGGFDQKNMNTRFHPIEEFKDVTDERSSMDDKRDEELELRDESDGKSSVSDLIADEFDEDVEDIELGVGQELTEEDTCRHDGNNVPANSEKDDNLQDLNSEMDDKNDELVQERRKIDIEDKSEIEDTKCDLDNSANESEKSDHDSVKSTFGSDLEDSILEDGEDKDKKVKTPIKKTEYVELTEITDDVLYLSDPDMDMFDEESNNEEGNGENERESLPVATESGDGENDLDKPAEFEVGSDSIQQEETRVTRRTPNWEIAKRPMWLPRGYCFNFFNNRHCAISPCTYNHNLPTQMEFLQSFKEHLEKGDDEICLDILQQQPNIHDKISNVQLEILHRRLCDNVESFWLLKIMNSKGTLNQIVVDNYIRTFGQLEHSDQLFAVFEMARTINMTLQPDVLRKLLEVFSSQEDLLDKLNAVMSYCTEDATFLLPANVIQTAIKGALKEPRLLNQLLVILTNINQLPFINQDLINRLCEASCKAGVGKERISQLQNLFKHSSQVYSHTVDSLHMDTGFDDSVEWSQQDEIFWMDNVKSVKYTKNFTILASLYNEKRARELAFTTEECDQYIEVIAEDKAFVDGSFRQFLDSVKNTQSEGSFLLFKQQFGYIACRLFESCFNYKLLPACIGILSSMHMYDLLPISNDLFVLNAVKVCLHGALAEWAVAFLKGVKLDQMRPQIQADLITLFNPLVEQLASKNLKTECLFVLHWAFLLVYNGII